MTIGSNENRIRTFLTPDEMAECLAVSKTTLYRLVAKRQIPFYKIGGSLRFKKDEMEKYFDDCRIGPIKI